MENSQEIIISGVHLSLTEAIKAHVTKKMERLFRHEFKIIRIRVELIQLLSKTRDEEFEAKAIIEVQGPSIILSIANKDLYKAIDLLVDRLDRKLRIRKNTALTKRYDSTVRHIDPEVVEV